MKTPNSPLRIGVAGLSHDHVWHELSGWSGLPGVEIVAASDPHEAQRDRFTRDYPAAKNVYANWQAMLQAVGDTLDIVQIAAPNNQHADITEASAKLGLHVITEKPMASTVEEANRMVSACQAANVRLFVNWPTQWSAAHQEMERRILAGDIGDVRYFKYRSAHNGPKEIGCTPAFYEWLYDGEQNGAGALMDYCCYGAAMCARFLGLPEKVTGLRGVFAKDYPLPDDNAIIAMQYAHAFGVAEASWTQTVGYATANPVAYGSGGSIAILGGSVVLTQTGKKAETITPPPTTAPYRNGPEYFLHCLRTGEPLMGVGAPDVSRDAQAILSAGLRAARHGADANIEREVKAGGPLPPAPSPQGKGAGGRGLSFIFEASRRVQSLTTSIFNLGDFRSCHPKSRSAHSLFSPPVPSPLSPEVSHSAAFPPTPRARFNRPSMQCRE